MNEVWEPHRKISVHRDTPLWSKVLHGHHTEALANVSIPRMVKSQPFPIVKIDGAGHIATGGREYVPHWVTKLGITGSKPAPCEGLSVKCRLTATPEELFPGMNSVSMVVAGPGRRGHRTEAEEERRHHLRIMSVFAPCASPCITDSKYSNNNPSLLPSHTQSRRTGKNVAPSHAFSRIRSFGW